MAQPYVNERAYDFSQVSVKLASMSIPFAGFLGIEYDDAQDMEMNYGAGVDPVSYSLGNIRCTCTLRLSGDEARKLQQASPNGRLQDRLPEDLLVTYNNPARNKVVTDRIRLIKFKNNPSGLNQNDPQMEVELEIMTPQIIRG